jgi:hypothetical protein
MPMYGDMILKTDVHQDFQPATRFRMGFAEGRDEAWLRDLLGAHPHLLPIDEVDPSFAPSAPLCTEMRTEAGSVDVALISPTGRLTLVECKLWRNPEARRKVVAQILDYARAISRWTYADLQRQVAAATGRKGNVPFEAAKALAPDLDEAVFVDATARALREGRFLLLIAGDGIREGVSGITDLITRNAALGFSFGLVEVALYGFGEDGLIVQPRVVARTETIERLFVRVVTEGEETIAERFPDDGVESAAEGGEDPAAADRAWWEPLTQMTFDDPEQEPPAFRPRNHVRAQMPYPGLWITAYRSISTGVCGVFLAGFRTTRSSALEPLNAERDAILEQLPNGIHPGSSSPADQPGFYIEHPLNQFDSDDACRQWLADTLNQFVNTFRPRLKALARNQHAG